MKIKVFEGIYNSNCYILSNNKDAVIIDAGVNGDIIKKYLDEFNLKAEIVLLTHGHFDHIFYANDLKEKLGVKVFIHEADEDMLYNPNLNLSTSWEKTISLSKVDRTLKNGERLNAIHKEFEIIHTPGHSKGGICIKVDDILFSGDTLFNMSIGRTDLAGGDMDELFSSIEERLWILDNDTKVYPGHGTSTTIGWQKHNNPFFTS